MRISGGLWAASFGILLGAATAGLPRAAHAQGAPGVVSMQYTMRDGSVIVGTPVAEDESTVTIQTMSGELRVYKANIAAMSAVGGGAVSPPMQPPPPAVVGQP